MQAPPSRLTSNKVTRPRQSAIIFACLAGRRRTTGKRSTSTNVFGLTASTSPDVARPVHRAGASISGKSKDRHLKRQISARSARDRKGEDQALQRCSGMDVLLLH